MDQYEKDLILFYESLRKAMSEVYQMLDILDGRLVEMENELPDWYTYPGDPELKGLVPKKKNTRGC